MLRMTNALGLQGVGMLLTLWSFIVASLFGVVVASPTIGLMAAVTWAICLLAVMVFLAPVRFISMILLHEEIRRVLLPSRVQGTQLPFMMHRVPSKGMFGDLLGKDLFGEQKVVPWGSSNQRGGSQRDNLSSATGEPTSSTTGASRRDSRPTDRDIESLQF